MKTTKENIKKTKQHPMLMDASNIQNQDAYNALYTSFMNRMNYNVTIQLDGSISILKSGFGTKTSLV